MTDSRTGVVCEDPGEERDVIGEREHRTGMEWGEIARFERIVVRFVHEARLEKLLRERSSFADDAVRGDKDAFDRDDEYVGKERSIGVSPVPSSASDRRTHRATGREVSTTRAKIVVYFVT